MNFYKKLAKFIQNIPKNLALGVLWLYKTLIAPLYIRHHCVFYPGCSQYAKECFEKYDFFTAFKKSLKRISRCHPGTEPQVDLP